MKNFIKKAAHKGFSLVELLVVVVILGVLAGIVTFAVGGLSSTSAEAACAADKKTVEIAVEAHNAQKGEYADSVADLVTAGLLRSAPGSYDGLTAITTNDTGAVSGCAPVE